jgi:hypothetical protein
MLTLKERAENFSFEELEGVDSNLLNPILMNRLNEYFSDASLRYPMFLIGDKGSGKTLHVIKSLSKNVYSNNHFVPVMFLYKKSERKEILEPTKLAPKEVWGSRCEELERCSSEEELMSTANVLVSDDVNYMFEAVARGKENRANIVSHLQKLSALVDKGKKVLLVSEEPPLIYAEKINMKELDEVLLKFGQMPYHRWGKMNFEEWQSYEERVSYPSFYEVPDIDFTSWSRLFSIYGVDADETVTDFLFRSSRKPRAFVKFSNLFQKNKPGKTYIETEDMIEKALEFLPQKVRTPEELRFFSYTLNFPEITTSRYESVPEILKMETKIKLVQQNMGEIQSLSKKLLEGITGGIYESNEQNESPSHILAAKIRADPSLDSKLLNTEYLSSITGKQVDYEVLNALKICLANPAISAFLEINEVVESRRKNKRNLDSVLENYGLKVVRNIYPTQTDPHSVKLFSPACNDESTLVLTRPLQIAFHDVLYETPTLDILNYFSS